MDIIRGLENLGVKRPCAVTIGTFDGMHCGHRQIIKKLRKIAGEKRLCSTLITFDPHPRTVVRKESLKKIPLLTMIDEKLGLLRNTKLDRVLIIPFNKAFSQIDYKDFVREILIDKLNARALVIGYDHVFGRNREGNFANLERLRATYGFSLDEVEPYEKDGQIVNSTFIRQFLFDGDAALAAKLLGRNYSITGFVVHGSDRGKALHFPTANLQALDENKLIPGNGVYTVDVEYKGDLYKGMLNIGYKPTFEQHGTITVEVHIIDFNKSIYGEQLSVYFKKRLRDEKKFDSKEALIAQLEIDKQESLK